MLRAAGMTPSKSESAETGEPETYQHMEKTLSQALSCRNREEHEEKTLKVEAPSIGPTESKTVCIEDRITSPLESVARNVPNAEDNPQDQERFNAGGTIESQSNIQVSNESYGLADEKPCLGSAQGAGQQAEVLSSSAECAYPKAETMHEESTELSRERNALTRESSVASEQGIRGTMDNLCAHEKSAESGEGDARSLHSTRKVGRNELARCPSVSSAPHLNLLFP